MQAKIIAIDGPAGAGKSTVSKLLAQDLRGCLLDTGAFYRTLTLALTRLKVSPADVSEEVLKSLQIRQEFRDNQIYMYLNDVNVNEEIRSEEVSKNVSTYAAIGIIRTFAVALQQSYIIKCVEQNQDVVIEGRDIATVVAPNADLKIFLTASADVRAQRRSAELSSSLSETLESINARDFQDSTREVSPLKKSDDAFEIDASNLTQQEVVDIIKSLVNDGAK